MCKETLSEMVTLGLGRFGSPGDTTYDPTGRGMPRLLYVFNESATGCIKRAKLISVCSCRGRANCEAHQSTASAATPKHMPALQARQEKQDATAARIYADHTPKMSENNNLQALVAAARFGRGSSSAQGAMTLHKHDIIVFWQSLRFRSHPPRYHSLSDKKHTHPSPQEFQNAGGILLAGQHPCPARRRNRSVSHVGRRSRHGITHDQAPSGPQRSFPAPRAGYATVRGA